VSEICRRWILENAVILPDLLQSCFKAVLKLFQSLNKPARRKKHFVHGNSGKTASTANAGGFKFRI
jgi:hypothetical protein